MDRRKLLIADDSEMNRAMLANMLDHDFQIIEAVDGHETISALEMYKGEIAALLLDIVMPEMDGFQVLEEMQRRGWTESVPTIMISAEMGSAYIDRAFELGASDYINRPFATGIIRRRIINAILGIFFLFRKMYLKLYLFKIQIFKTFLNLFFKHFSLLLPQCRKLSCQFQILLRQLLTGFLQFLHISIIIFQNPESFFLLLTVCHDLFIRIPILCLQMIDLVQPLFCLIEFFIREFTVFLIFCQFMIKIIQQIVYIRQLGIYL